MIPYDEDIVRAVGHVAIYSAYLEEELQKLICTIKKFVHIKNDLEKFRLSSQAENLIKILKIRFKIIPAYPENDKIEILRILKTITTLAKKRNDILHSVLMSKDGKYVQINQKNKSSTPITTKEVRKLADEIDQLQRAISEINSPHLYESLTENQEDKSE